MIIVAGHLLVDPAERAVYLEATADVARLARAARGCLGFVQVADPLEADRIVIYERWETDADLTAFRTSGTDEPVATPDILGADVAKYRISAVESP
ncbi:MAG: antibiotic biosynthesis monooxygenase [Geodermatophilaceae bacterium]|nr:antibiotic biosynthesis monooxygenase [Geodermatophilaceae bacterium]